MASSMYESAFAKGLRWLARLAFLGLCGFECANYFQWLHFPLEYTWFGLLATSATVILGIEMLALFLRRFHGVQMHWMIWPLAFIGVSVDAFGDLFHWYDASLWYDRLAHLFGAFLLGIIFTTILLDLRRAKGWTCPRRFVAFTAFTSSVALGAVYEIEEYLEDFFHHTHRLGNGPDTANDLLMDILGSFIAVVFVLFMRWIWRRLFP